MTAGAGHKINAGNLPTFFSSISNSTANPGKKKDIFINFNKTVLFKVYCIYVDSIYCCHITVKDHCVYEQEAR